MYTDTRGLIEAIPSDTRDFIFGADKETPMPYDSLAVDRDWSKHLPLHEKQYNRKFDTYGCVSFSALNCIETMARKRFGYNWNLSDRYIVVASETRPGYGNYLHKVASTIRTRGVIEEEEYPFPMNMSLDEYYASIPQELHSKAREATRKFDFHYQWVDWAGVNPNKLYQALQFGPVQCTVDARSMAQNKKATRTNHAVMAYKAVKHESISFFDHYRRSHTVDWDHYIGSAMRFDISKKNYMITLAKGTGSDIYALGKDGKLYRVEDSMAALQAGVVAGLWDGNIKDMDDDEIEEMEIAATINLYKSLRE